MLLPDCLHSWLVDFLGPAKTDEQKGVINRTKILTAEFDSLFLTYLWVYCSLLLRLDFGPTVTLKSDIIY